MRGGTSKGLLLHQHDLPPTRDAQDSLFLAVMGSPDPSGRQLNGMGGGVSSVSKVCIIATPSRPDADVDYTFAQVMVDEARVEYGGNCGNMSSAVGPFALDEGLVACQGDEATVRIHNTNTGKIIVSRFPVRDGRAVVNGPLAIPGVPGTGAPIRLDFLDPGGATTGRLLPTGQVRDRMDVPGFGPVDASMIDAANACVFVDATALGLQGTELPAALAADARAMALLSAVREQASVAMGITRDLAAARAQRLVPFIGVISAPQAASTLDGAPVAAADVDLTVRFLSSGKPHLALPLTASLCTAVAARVTGSLVHAAARAGVDPDHPLRLGMPSGVLTVGADVDASGALPHARSGAFYRTARRLFDGRVYG